MGDTTEGRASGPRRFTRTPWRRLWPAATAVAAAHLLLLGGWPVNRTGLLTPQRADAPTMAVRTFRDDRPISAGPAQPQPLPQQPAARVGAEVARIASLGAQEKTAIAFPPAPDYRAAGLDPGPRPLGDIDPIYPPEAGLQVGSVVLRLRIGADGKVDDARVVRSNPKGVFDSAAVEAFLAARFSPGLFLGVPVKSEITIEVEFTPTNRGAEVSPRTY